MRSYFLCMVVFYLGMTECVRGAIDFSGFNPSNQNHIQALLNFQDVLEGYPQGRNGRRQPDPSVLNLYDPNNQEHVKAHNRFRANLKGASSFPLLDAVKANPALAAELAKPRTPPSIFPTLSMPGVPSLPSISVSSIGAYLGSWISFKAIFKTLLTIMWTGVAFLIPALAVMTPIFNMALELI